MNRVESSRAEPNRLMVPQKSVHDPHGPNRAAPTQPNQTPSIHPLGISSYAKFLLISSSTPVQKDTKASTEKKPARNSFRHYHRANPAPKFVVNGYLLLIHQHALLPLNLESPAIAPPPHTPSAVSAAQSQVLLCLLGPRGPLPLTGFACGGKPRARLLQHALLQRLQCAGGGGRQ